jgi:hypothetical protein
MKTILWVISACLVFAPKALAQGTYVPTPGFSAPVLQPGEGFAWASADGTFKDFGEDSKEAPMGSLAELLWLRLEGEEWAARMVSFKCKGELSGLHCWNRKGHGKVDLAKAMVESCNLAFLVWSTESAERWKKDYGEGAARYRLDQVFRSFLGNRLKPGETLPVLGPEWIGDGDLLQTTPLAMAKWLADVEQEPVYNLCKRLLSGAFDGWITKSADWWFKTGASSGPVDSSATFTWVVGSNGERSVVLHLPKGRGKMEALARMKEILLLPKK